MMRWLLLLFACTILGQPAIAQEVDSTGPKTVVAGLVTITNNGISVVPAFSLGKPAAIVDAFIARSVFAFEPELRWGLDGKPWSIILWGRYRQDRGNFHMTIGGHPALNFVTTTVTKNQTEKEIIAARRYLAGELNPSYSVAKHVILGVYYLYSHGFEPDAARNINFLALRTTFLGVPLAGRYFVSFAPQLFYLNVDARDGFYFHSLLTVGKRNFPFFIGAQVNRTIQTNIVQPDDFIWNLSLSYSIQ